MRLLHPTMAVLVAAYCVGCSAAEQLPAFPGAEGFGAYAVGGRGGRIVHVTNLNAHGEGSFAWAVNEVHEPRTIVFDVSGVIDCEDEVEFEITAENDHVTIAGETSPGGIAVYNYRSFVIRDGAEHVIVRFLRLRGTTIDLDNDPDGILIWHARNVIIDHCSVAGACDETISASGTSDKITVQWTGFDESRKEKAHRDYFENNGQWHNYGGLYTLTGSATVHHCLFAHHSKRNPLADEKANVESINNVVYNYSNSQQKWGSAGPGLTVVGCYYKLGPDRRSNPVPVRDDVKAIEDCISKEGDGRDGPEVKDQGTVGQLSVRTIHSAEDGFEIVLARAGALPHDATSARMVRETRGATGRQGYSASMEDDALALKAHPLPPDTDRDGIPDEWEAAHGLDKSDPNDAGRITPSRYSYLELYCHERAEELIRASTRS